MTERDDGVERVIRQEPAARAAPARFSLRAPLLAKLLVSQLVVLALILVPSYFMVRAGARQAVPATLSHELAAEVSVLAQRLGEVPPAELRTRVAELVRTMPVRVTVVNAAGDVLGDTVGLVLENHGSRPEIRRALTGVAATAMRRSQTTGQTMIYAAHRFPVRGPARGVVRLSVPTARADATAGDVLSFVDQAGAAALSLALVLSLVAAVLISRPLRRIAHGARALAAGDLGHVVDVRSRDELGEVAAALEELAAQLQERLLESGVDRMTLRALLDDLPVGAIVYDAERAPQVINGAARRFLDLSPATENEQARRLLEEPVHAPVVARVLESRMSEEQSLSVPWRRSAALRGRWLAVARADGGPRPALLLWPDEERERQRVRDNVVRWSDLLRALLPEVRDPARASEVADALRRMDRARAGDLPRPDEVESVTLGDLCRPPLEAARAVAPGVHVAVDLAEPEMLVVECGGRVEAALRRMLLDAARAGEPGATVRLRGEPSPTHVRLSLRARSPVKTKWLANQVACLGGEAGALRDGDEVEVWLTVPRA